MKYGKRVMLGDDFVNWYNRFYEKEKLVKKSVEIEGNLYDKLKEIGVRIDIWTHLMRGCIINYVH